jgi:hypothetical protein
LRLARFQIVPGVLNRDGTGVLIEVGFEGSNPLAKILSSGMAK